MLKKLSYKLILSYIALIFILVISVFLMVENLLKKTHIEMIKNEMSHEIGIINTSLLKNQKNPLNDPGTYNILHEFSRAMGLRITLVDNTGRVVADTEAKSIETLDNHFYRTEIYQAMQSGQGSSIRHSNTLKTDMLYLAKPFD